MDYWYDVISIIRKVFTEVSIGTSVSWRICLISIWIYRIMVMSNGNRAIPWFASWCWTHWMHVASHWLHADHAGIFEMIIFTERNRRLTEQHVHLFLYYDVRCSQMNTIWRMAWKPIIMVFMPLSFVHERIVFNGFHSTIPAIVHEFNDTHECNARMVSVEWFQCRDSNPDLHAFDMACCHWHHMTFSIRHVINDSIWNQILSTCVHRTE